MEHSAVESCGALIYARSTHRYLFLLRNSTSYKSSWGLVGGKLEPGERVVDALRREIKEEIDFDLGDDQKIIPIEKFTSANDKFCYHTFIIQVEDEFLPVLNHEHRGYCWVQLEDYPKPLHPGVWRTFKFESIVNKIRTMEQV
jgi:8-oxo-dGTP pyrophosphatase MutT (NUDIX family)